MECQCVHCQRACLKRPGFFAADGLKPLAAFLKLSVKDLFKTYLRVDFGILGDSPYIAITPATTNSMPGEFAPMNPTGQCVFYKAGKCSIQEVKPAECRFWDHSKTQVESRMFRERLMHGWAQREGQKQLRDLLGVKDVGAALEAHIQGVVQ